MGEQTYPPTNDQPNWPDGISALLGTLMIGIGLMRLLTPSEHTLIGLALIVSGVAVFPPITSRLRRFIPLLRVAWVPAGVAATLLAALLAAARLVPAKSVAEQKTAAFQSTPSYVDPKQLKPTDPAPNQSPTAEVKAQADDLWNAIKVAANACDEANNGMPAILEALRGGTSSASYAYMATEVARQRCKDAHSSINSMKPPAASSGAIRNKFEEAIESCRTGYLFRSSALGKMSKVVQGDYSPKTLQGFQIDSKMAQASIKSCAVKFREATEDYGVNASAG